MDLEQTLASWTGPSSQTEQDKQERTERMVREAVQNHAGFDDCSLSVYAKGSYPNNTNVKSDSDVDIVVQCHDVVYSEEHPPGVRPTTWSAYTGIWTPSKLRSELAAALETKFSGKVDTSGTTAIVVNSSSARMDADVVPSFDYVDYFSWGTRDGTRVFKKDGLTHIDNYPAQHLLKGRAKNTATNNNFKKMVRILKRVENQMVEQGVHREVPSYFVECLAFNCPNDVFGRPTWTATVRDALFQVWDNLQGDVEPTVEGDRWLEVNRFFAFQRGVMVASRSQLGLPA